MTDRDSPPADAPPTPPSHIARLRADLLPEREDLHPTLDAIVKERAEQLNLAATVAILRYRDPVEGLVTRHVLRFHEDDDVDAIVLGNHPRCDGGRLPNAESKHMVVFCQAPSDQLGPRCSLYAVHRDSGLLFPPDTELLSYTNADVVLCRRGVPWSVAVGDALVFVFQLCRGQPARRLWTAPGADDPTDYDALIRERDKPEKDKDTLEREQRLDDARANIVDGIRDSLFQNLPGEDEPLPEVLFPSVTAEVENEHTAVRPPGVVRRCVDVWIEHDDLYYSCVLGRGARFCVAPDLLGHPEVSREHAFLFFEDNDLWLVDLVSSGGTRMIGRFGHEVYLNEYNRVARVVEGARFRLANTPLDLQRIPARSADEWAEINRVNPAQ